LRPKEKDYYYKVAENYFARSFALFPHYPQTEYAYLFHLMNSGKKEEALLMAKNILSRDPRVEQSQYYYGLLLYMVHPEKNADEALIHLEIALEQDIDPLPQLTGKVYNALMAHTYQASPTKTTAGAVNHHQEKLQLVSVALTRLFPDFF
jgi:tetratricopeptide (TPR) repeat protein